MSDLSEINARRGFRAGAPWPSDPPAMSTNGDIGPASPCGDIDDNNVNWWTDVDYLLVRARCCRDWPVLAATRIGRCGYCGQVPVVIGPW